MSSDPPKAGIFSTLSRRSAKSNKPVSETLTHPLLGASTSSLNLSDPSASTTANDISTSPTSGHTRQGSGTASRNVSMSGDVLNVPYKPRTKGSHGSTHSVSSISSLTASNPTTVPAQGLSSVTVTSPPITPTGAMAPPVTSTSASATFALPPSTADTTTTMDTSTVTSTAPGSSSTATSRLQQQSLKATAQRIGLGNGTLGMAIIDAIYERGQQGKGKGVEGAEWAEISKVLSSTKAILLLPSTSASSTSITPQIVRDHVAFMAPSLSNSNEPKTAREAGSSSSLPDVGSSKVTSMLVTLSGLVGTVTDSHLTFESTFTPEVKLFAAIKDNTTRPAVLASLRPTSLTQSLSASTSSLSTYPDVTISSWSALLNFPPLGKPAGATSSEGNKEKERVASGKLGRINPFASFFGSAPTPAADPAPAEAASETPNPTSDRPLSPVNRDLSPKPSLLSMNDTASIRSENVLNPEGYQVTAYTIGKQIKHADVSKSLSKAIKSTIRDELHRFPDKLVDRVYKLVLQGACPTHPASESKSDPAPPVQLDYDDPTACGEKLQDFIEGIYDDLIVHFRADSSHIFAESSDTGFRIKRKASWSNRGHASLETEEESEEVKKARKEKARRERDAAVERDASEGADKVEAVICRLLYNRLFSPLCSDDARHDEALSSRVAALNMLDLTLDHLGLITHPANPPPGEEGLISKGLADIVERVGLELQKLSMPSCLTPKEKADVLIKAHQLVVDGLTGLPPVDLRPEGEPYRPSPQPTSPEPTPTTTDDKSLTRTLSPPGAQAYAIPRRPSSSSSASSTPLSTSPSQTDPLSTIEEVIEKTPQALHTSSSSASVPQLVLPESSALISEAMSDSVMTVAPTPSSTNASPAASPAASPSSQPARPRGQTSGADLILPIIIFAVVKSNPSQLASQLMYLRRYRSAICLSGEASYAIVNLTAVVEFLEHVGLAELGLGEDSDKVISVEDLTPIGLGYLDDSNADAASIASASSRLRGRVFQVGELAGSAADSANKVLTGVVDSSWTALRGLISAPNATSEAEHASASGTVPPPNGRPGMRPRQASTFSLASVTASVATIAAAAASRSTRSRANSRVSTGPTGSTPKEETKWKGNEEMVEVTSRPASVYREKEKSGEYPSSDDASSPEHSDDEGTKHDEPKDDGRRRSKSDARSVRSISSLNRPRGEIDDGKERVSISDRLASIGVLGRLPYTSGEMSPPQTESPGVPGIKTPGILANLAGGRSRSGSTGQHSRRLSLLGSRSDFNPNGISSPAGSVASLPIAGVAPGSAVNLETIDPPLEQFMDGEVGDMRLSEIGVLLRDYRRLGNIINALTNATTQSK